MTYVYLYVFNPLTKRHMTFKLVPNTCLDEADFIIDRTCYAAMTTEERESPFFIYSPHNSVDSIIAGYLGRELLS